MPRSIQLPDVKVVADKYTQRGPLAGIQAGICASSCDYNFVCACDMPYLNTMAVGYIGAAAVGYDVAVPFIEGYYNPLHGVYHRNCLPYIERQLEQECYRIISLYNEIKLRCISAEELRQFDRDLDTLSNINTLEDLQGKI